MANTKTSSPAKGGATDRDVDIHTYKGSYEAFNKNWMNEQGIKIDWRVKERNKHWHDTYFTKRAAKDHQAKGNCRFAHHCIEELENQKWIDPGDLVFDPMCGIGSFLIVAALKGYNGVGIELEERFYKDMIGYDEHAQIDDPMDLFAGYSVHEYHIVGCIEKFHRLTGSIPKVGRISIINGDARKAHELLPSNTLRLDSKGKVFAVSSPPYGNRLRDVMQIASADDGLDWSKVDTDHDRQYSNDNDNIGTHKIAIVSSPPYSGTTEIGGQAKGGPLAKASGERQNRYSEDNIARNRLTILSSPPYSRSTEHNASQIDALPDEKVGGHRGFLYTDRKNIALLKLGQYDIAMLNVYEALYKTVGIGSPVVLLTRNFIQEGKIVLLDELTIRLMEKAGFTYKFTKRAELPEISMFKYMNWNKCHREKELPLITWEEATFYIKEH